MTDDIKVGDRFPVVGVARHFNSSSGTWAIEFGTGARSWFMSIPVDTLAEYERLPPEIGVGDRVECDRKASNGALSRTMGHVAAVAGDWTLIEFAAGPVQPTPLSDLSLVKKAEKAG